MLIRPTRIFSLSENAITVEFGSEMSEEVNAAAIRLADHFTEKPFAGHVESVPAMASATIFYRPHRVSRPDGESAFEAVQAEIERAVETVSISASGPTRRIEIPVSFAPENALDLDEIARHAGLGGDEAIHVFISTEYRVYMLGFLPGFAYMGTVDQRIAIPRRSSPRLIVPRGSVGIAGRQTGVYPTESPGGWQIIGRTDHPLFDETRVPPCFLAPGDSVRFIPV